MATTLGALPAARQLAQRFGACRTLIPFAGLWVAIAWFSAIYEITFFLTVPAAGFLVRLFMIQHDCGHGSMFSRREVNDWIGRFLGVLTLTPYDHWRRSHAHHHAGSGNLDRRGIGDITTLTVREYAALGTPDQVLQRITEYVDAGATKFVMRPYGPKRTHEELVRILAKEVIPALQTPFSLEERHERSG